MSNWNTAKKYGRIAKWIHWITALLFLVSYFSVYYRHLFTERKTPENLAALQIHMSVGITVGVIVILRIVWRYMNVQPVLEPGPAWQQHLARWNHYALYAVMILMPISGYLKTGLDNHYFFLFHLPKFEDTWLFHAFVQDYLGMTFKEFKKPVDVFHKEIMGAVVVWMLIVGHAAAALYHHYRLKDRTLTRMIRG
jgi:cytochrome b561